ncbi:MAG: sulfatase-like hydrolase/transferase [Actinomycetia bacterium]|nr:sulfatase-like hydrolase/transferase [Actinomycetes bacterium]
MDPLTPTPRSSRSPSRSSAWPRELGAFFELLALAAVAITQPVFDTFARSPETFVLRRADTSDIVMFSLAVALAPALLTWALTTPTGLISRRWRRAGHLIGVATLGTLVGVQIVRRLLGLSGPRLVISALIIGVGLAVVRSRSAGLGSWLRLLAIFPAALVVWFLGLSPVGDTAFGSETIGGDGIRIGEPHDVVFIVFDELPTASLLGADGGMNGDVFPSFASLAADSTWYRNHSGAGPSTPQAVPAILTGIWPDPEALPVSKIYPRNLFTLLGVGYEQNSWEIGTDLCPDDLCPDEDRTILTEPLPELLTDAWTVLTDQLDDPAPDGEVIDFQIRQSEPQAPRRFERFIASLETEAGGPRLDLLHILYPHQPWFHIPDGRRYSAPFIAEGLGTRYHWSTPELADQARHRHLLQLGHADQLLGEVLDRLRELGRYDDSLIVVTADHGVAFLPGEPIRGLSEGNWEQIMWTPLLIKEPGQTIGATVDDPATAVDVLPTVAQHLDVRFDSSDNEDWTFAGRALQSDPSPQPDSVDVRHHLPWKLNVLEPDEGEPWMVFDGGEGFERLLDRIEPAGALGGGKLALWRFGRWGHLVGQDLGPLTQRPETVEGSVQDLDQWSDVVTLVDELPLWLGGSVDLPAGTTADVLVAFNGRISGWSQAWTDDGDHRFAVVIPPDHLIDGANRIEIFLVGGSADVPEVTPVDVGDVQG